MSHWLSIFFALLLVLAASPVSAGSVVGTQCQERSSVSKSMLVAVLNDGIAAKRVDASKNLLGSTEAVPRSEWIRVAPLVVRRCCGGYDCDQRSGTCVCRRWCD